MNSQRTDMTRKHLLTVLLEDYFHVGAFNRIIQRGQWYRFQTRFEQNTVKALDLLDRHNIKATFFVLGWIADRQPELVREVAKRGHEIASRGYYHRSIRQMTPTEFREDLARSRDALERASETKVIGYRAARRLASPTDLWALDILAEEGYAYDSSIAPPFRSSMIETPRRFAYQHKHADKEIWEFPVSTFNLLGWNVPIAGGNYFRQFPHSLVKRAVEQWHQKFDAPFVMYFHVWELDPEQPRINVTSPLTRIRHYRKLDKMSGILEHYFNTYQFVGGAEYLGLSTELDATSTEKVESLSSVQQRTQLHLADESSSALTEVHVKETGTSGRAAVSIVVPCYNEELVLPYLSNTLRSVEAKLEEEYDVRFIFVDDCSHDGTWDSLNQLFGTWPNCAFLRHTQNKGVAAAILTGISHADTDVVCSIDCDCTYDPHELRNMIPRLTEGVDMVTASPYHPQGEVRNVPAWRLSLSKTASFLYRQVLRQRLYTYTSCFRAYRRSAVADLHLRENGFLGIAEMLGRLDLQGSKVVEYPTTLEVRLFGRSKMKVYRTIVGHLGLMSRLLLLRLRRPKATDAAASQKKSLLADAPLSSGYRVPPISSQK